MSQSSFDEILNRLSNNMVELVKLSTVSTTYTDKTMGLNDLDVRNVSEIPSVELSRDVATQALDATLHAHSMVADAEKLMKHVLALKVKVITQDKHRHDHAVTRLRHEFESQNARNEYVIDDTILALSQVIADIETHLSTSVASVIE